MKDILLKLKGKTVKSRGVLDDIELVTEGKLRLQGGAIMLSYEESDGILKVENYKGKASTVKVWLYYNGNDSKPVKASFGIGIDSKK